MGIGAVQHCCLFQIPGHFSFGVFRSPANQVTYPGDFALVGISVCGAPSPLHDGFTNSEYAMFLFIIVTKNDKILFYSYMTNLLIENRTGKT